MNDFWLKVKVWTKIGLFAVLALFTLVFIVENNAREVKIWFWHDYNATVLSLLFFAFLFGVVITLLVRTTLLTLRQVADLKERNRAVRMERDLTQMRNEMNTRPPTTP